MASFDQFIDEVQEQIPAPYHDQIVFSQNKNLYSAHLNNLKIHYSNGWYKVTTDGTRLTESIRPYLVDAIMKSYDLLVETVSKFKIVPK